MKMLRITLEGKSYEVGVEVIDELASTPSAPDKGFAASSAVKIPPQVSLPSAGVEESQVVTPGCSVIASPMAGLVLKCLVKPGDVVKVNETVVVLDAMKMETPIRSSVAGTVRSVQVKEGDAVGEGQCLLQVEG